jgi:hydroxymethylglutaryl-CoA lyase
VPSMADADALCAALPRRGGVSFSGLVLNDKGYERARRAGLDEVTMVVVATDTFSEKNQGLTTEAAAEQWCRIAAMARQDGIRSSVTIAAAFGCPYEGRVPIERVAAVAVAVAAGRPDEIVLADTIGVGVPTQVDEIVSVLHQAAPGVRLRGHFHDTRNAAVANAVAALRAGVAALDASVGGIGGCPFAPGATGNVATEDLVYVLEGMGVATGIDLAELVGIVPWLEHQLGHAAPGHVSKVAAFPGALSAPSCVA